MQILGLAGRAKAGKTTLARHMAKLLVDSPTPVSSKVKGPDGIVRYVPGKYGLPRLLSFAGPLKSAAAMIGAEKEKRPELYRKFCQIVGTEMCRNPEYVPGTTGPDYWVKMMELEFLKAERDEQNGVGERGEIFIIIDDVRFPNEVELIHKWGGSVLFVCADGRLTDLDAEYRKHESEKMAMEYSDGKMGEMFDFAITNHKSTEGFLEEGARFMYLFLGGDASYEAGMF